MAVLRTFSINTWTPFQPPALPAGKSVQSGSDFVTDTVVNVSWFASASVTVAIETPGGLVAVGSGVSGIVPNVALTQGQCSWLVVAGAAAVSGFTCYMQPAEAASSGGGGGGGGIGVSVLAYGADPTGVNDSTAAIQRAISSLGAVGGVVLFPAGVYYLGTGPVFNATAAVNNIWLRGSGRGATTLKANGALAGGNADLIRIVVPTASTYGESVWVTDMTLDCSAQTAGNGMTLQGINDLRIERVTVNLPFGFGLDHGSVAGLTPHIERPRIRDLVVVGERSGADSVGGGGIDYGSYADIWVVDGAGIDYVKGTALDLTNITGCEFSRIVAVTANPAPTAAAIASDFASSGCTFSQCYTAGFKLGALFSSVAGEAAHAYLTLRDFVVASCLDSAIAFFSAAALGPVHLTIENPRIEAWDSSASGQQGIDLQGAQHFSIRGGTFGPNVYGEYPIRLDQDGTNPCNFGLIAGVDLTACTLGVQYSSVGTSMAVRSNPGYNPVGVVTPAVPASGVAVAAAPYDRTFYVTDTVAGTTCAISGGPTVTIPSGGTVPITVPAGATLTPTYTTAPTWVVMGL